MIDDCIEFLGGTSTNHGTITTSTSLTAGSNNNGLAVGSSTLAATFINTSNNSLNAVSNEANARAVYVFEMGTLDNTGTITVSGSNTNSGMYSRGIVNNLAGATIDMSDGRVNNNAGTLTNDGLVVSTRASGAGVFNTAVAINNGFFKYDNSNQFSTGNGTNTDNGINLNDAGQTTIDAAGGTLVNIAAATYDFLLQWCIDRNK